MRDLLRHAVRPLPAGVQIALRQLRTALTGEHDWAPAIRQLRLEEQPMLDAIATAEAARPDRQRILVCAVQQSPPWLDTSCSLAMALRLRGHDVRTVLCDGLVPICEMNLAGNNRPPCDVCVGWLERYHEAFGFESARLSAQATPGDRDDAERVVRLAASEDPSLTVVLVDGVDLGPLARRELRRFRRGFVFDPSKDDAYRSWLVSGVLLLRLIGRLLERERPDIVVQSSGRTLVAACVMAAARARGVRVVTWDTEPSFADGLVFSHDRPAVEIPLEQAWRDAAEQPLTDAERDRVLGFLARWSRSDGTPFPYNPTPTEDPHAIRSTLGLGPGRRLIAAFANSAWDMAVVDRDVAFSSMFEWLFALVDYAIGHPQTDLVVRAHPAEVKVPPDLQSRTPVAHEIRNRYPSLPANVFLIDGHSPISSYVLADMADVAMVYSSRFGLELAMGGRRPWVAGDVTYRGKGFTRDVTSSAEMLSWLEAGERSGRLSSEERELAERFSYLWFFRYIVRVPLIRAADGRFALTSFQPLVSGGSPVLDRICDAIVTGAPFLDLERGPADGR